MIRRPFILSGWLSRLFKRTPELTEEMKRENARQQAIQEAWGRTVLFHIEDTTYPGALQ